MASQIRQPEGAFFKEPREFKRRFPNGFPVGPRTERRAKENAKLRKRTGINYCEVRISPNCTRNRYLSWAHSRKSRYLATSADWQEACRACCPCHDVLEGMSHARMAKVVRAAIASRKTVNASSVH